MTTNNATRNNGRDRIRSLGWRFPAAWRAFTNT